MSKLGIASTSFAGAAIGGKAGNIPGQVRVPALDTMQFLERCHSYGAAGIQAQIHGDPAKLRARAEELGMWIEAMIPVHSGDASEVEKAVINAKAAGCTTARDGMLAGRRYQTFKTTDEWNEWVTQNRKALHTAIPIFEKHKFTLALENHKDWTLDEYVGLFKQYSSEYFGACLDFGNSLSLLDDPMTVIEASAPYVKATHYKDVAITPYENGFLMSEVVLGQGFIDLPKVTALLLKANPKVRFSLEMITRDPLEVPCLSDKYWTAFPERNGVYLARTLRFLNEHKSAKPLPRVDQLAKEDRARVEEENVKACLRFANENKLLS